MQTSKNRNTRLRATIRKNTFTLPLRGHVRTNAWGHDYTALLLPVHEWALFENHSSDATHRPHPKRDTLKNPRTPQWWHHPDDESETDYDRRARKRMAEFVLREHYNAIHEKDAPDITWDDGDGDDEYGSIYGERVGYLAAWEAELLDLPVGTVWSSESELFDAHKPSVPVRKVQHLTPTQEPLYRSSSRALVIDATGRSPQRISRTRIGTRTNTWGFRQNDDGKWRVWEIAREAGVPAKAVIDHLRSHDEYVTCASATVYPHIAQQAIADLSAPREG